MTRFVVVGAGNMGTKWLRTVRDSEGAEPVALVDVDVDRAVGTAAAESLGGIVVAGSLDEALDQIEADAIVDATIPAAHRGVATAAMRAGLDVLSEKPAAASLAEALALAALAELHGSLLMVSQSRRFNPQLYAVRAALPRLGSIGHISARFFRGPHFGGFREQMASPLTVDMAIHLFDTARWIADSDPVAVTAVESNPGWSWFDGAASAAAVFEFSNGVTFSFDGSWVNRGFDTSWNGDWRVGGDAGSLLWSGDDPAVIQVADGNEGYITETLEPDPDALESLDGSLAAFLAARQSTVVPENEIHDNIRSLVMVEGVLLAASEGRRVDVDDLFSDARRQAIDHADDWGVPEVVDVLRSWAAVDDALRRHAPGSTRIV
ncbi:Gfo/Idh/MocA family protein [Amnibacterium flavum]|uniref:Oxidoreductase n=1 Tax=Amnibacterium flavum TaxID=2173173 RepID=A0A2V1HXX7_9MICO|nr:Gfo/Idh/MocA family oxidoreductase [Amnibacterium flavum]PVZ95567.1 oxidoreductase [Amnibacterium flavum]